MRKNDVRYQAYLARLRDNRETIYERVFARQTNDPRVRMLKNAKTNASRSGVECSISLEDIPRTTYCPFLGTKLRVNKGVAKPDSFSIDRIDSQKGYVPGNVQVLSLKANVVKSDATEDELLDFLQSLITFLRSHSDVSN